MKKPKANIEKIARWKANIEELRANIKDRAAQIASGQMEIPSQEFRVWLNHMQQEVEMMYDLDGLIAAEEQKK